MQKGAIEEPTLLQPPLSDLGTTSLFLSYHHPTFFRIKRWGVLRECRFIAWAPGRTTILGFGATEDEAREELQRQTGAGSEKNEFHHPTLTLENAKERLQRAVEEFRGDIDFNNAEEAGLFRACEEKMREAINAQDMADFLLNADPALAIMEAICWQPALPSATSVAAEVQ